MTNALVTDYANAYVTSTGNSTLTRVSKGALSYAIRIGSLDMQKAEPAYAAGCEQFANGDFSDAIESITFAAELGHCAAQLRLGNIHFDGEATKRDYAAAIYWFERASEQGEAKAQLKLGWINEAGLGLPPNSRRAVYWYRLAAEAGNADAQFNIGVKYDNGEGVEHNPEEAVRWFLLSAEQGFADARYFLAQALESGDGIERSVEEALDWYILAAESGHVAARARFWSLCILGEFVPESDEEALFAEEVGAALENPDCIFKTALRYAAGLEKCADLGKATELYNKSARLGHRESYNHLSILSPELRKTPFLMRNCVPAPKWILNDCGRVHDGNGEKHREMLLGAALGASRSQFEVAVALLNGVGVQKDVKQAVRWFEQSAAQNDAMSWDYLGYIYSNGLNGERQPAKAADCFAKSAQLGSDYGACQLARHCRHGDGVKKDIGAAIKYYLKSANNEYASAMSALGDIYSGQDSGGSDYAAAFSWYSKANALDSPSGAFGLGLLFGQGLGRRKNLKRAKQHFESAAIRDEYYAARLSEYLMTGTFVTKDLVESEKWRVTAEEMRRKKPTAQKENTLFLTNRVVPSRRERLLEKRRMARMGS